MAAGRKRVVILGAGGRDFHVFNTTYRDRPDVEVVAFTATQIPNIADRRYPSSLAGPLYPAGIEIRDERELAPILRERSVDEVVFAYSDVSATYLEERARVAREAGAGFRTFEVEPTFLETSLPVVAVCAVRTGCGKSQTTRRVAALLRAMGRRTVVVRHPMPYGDLERQALQRFASIEDLAREACTIEEMEEYEPHLRAGSVVFAGVDYARILRAAEKEADVLLWDGGNNDLPFFRPTVHVVVADPLRAGHELAYFPGRMNLERADAVVVNKIDSAWSEDVRRVVANVRSVNPRAAVVLARSPVTAADPGAIRGRRVLVVEDGPTLTHGDMAFGAGVVAARACGAREIVDPRPYAVGSIAATFRSYPRTGPVLPAMGYGEEQVQDLQRTINAVPCDVVIIGTPVDLRRIIDIKKPTVRVRYELQEIGEPTLGDILESFLKK
ncbi:MAG TPA: cyclic 2,3-diphosphoglycerate synthase, partial [Planctomycetota bacterium]|nr:cyclic 2,3-diphosphoglycerate synthase [Planctomycetota bacterium]